MGFPRRSAANTSSPSPQRLSQPDVGKLEHGVQRTIGSSNLETAPCGLPEQMSNRNASLQVVHPQLLSKLRQLGRPGPPHCDNDDSGSRVLTPGLDAFPVPSVLPKPQGKALLSPFTHRKGRPESSSSPRAARARLGPWSVCLRHLPSQSQHTNYPE